jgi:CelD/BcsL family acetyltransferase involved in cellulose biosynthesis
MTSDLATGHIEDAEAFAALAPEWWELWRRIPSATPFQSPAWLIPWWRHFHPGALFVMTIRDGERLVGLAPFYLEDGALGRRILPVGISLSDYLDVLLDPDYRAAAGQALIEHIAGEGSRWDEWDLEELAPDAAALHVPAPPGCEEVLEHQSPCPVLTLAGGQSTLQATVPSKQRRNLNLARNRVARRGEVLIEEGDMETAPAMLDLLFRLHRARWESRGEGGVLADDPVQGFHREAVPDLMKANLLRLFVLRIAGQPAAVQYGFVHRDRAYLYLTGFDPDFAFESPSVMLLGHAIELASREGVREVHFLRGAEAYKYDWGATDRWNMRRAFRIAGERRAHVSA